MFPNIGNIYRYSDKYMNSNRTEILSKIYNEHNKIHHFCLKAEWYSKRSLLYIYNNIFEETSFLNKFDNVSLRERIFYIEKDLYTFNKCLHCDNKTGFDNKLLKFHKTCGSSICLSKQKSINMKEKMLDINFKNKICKKMIIAARRNASKNRGKTLEEIYGKKLGSILRVKNRKHLSMINRDKNISIKKWETRIKNGTNCLSSETIKKIKESNIKTHNSLEYRKKRKKINDIVSKKLSSIMKNKILNGEFTPCITNSWTKWKSYINLENGIKRFRSNWDAAFWLINNKSFDYEKIRIPYVNSDGTDRVYIVDFYDSTTNTLYEIKPSSLIKSKNNKLKFNALIKYCNDNNCKYEIISDEWFRKNISNIDFSNQPQLLKSFKKWL